MFPPIRTDLPPSTHALSTMAYMHALGPRDGPLCPASIWSDPLYATAYAGTGMGVGVGNGNTDGLTMVLDSLRQMLYLLFCVSVHEHAWMATGYSVWGKERYLDRFWMCLDWAAVRDAYAWYAQPKH
jgi:superoxide dismutase